MTLNQLLKVKLALCAGLWGYIAINALVLPYQRVNPEFVPYTRDYVKLLVTECPSRAKDITNNYSIGFGDGGKNWIGLCEMRLNGFRVTIDSKYWKREEDDNNKRQLMYHELAHCFIHKQHVEDENNYMFFRMNTIPYVVYIEQVKKDIHDWCDR